MLKYYESNGINVKELGINMSVANLSAYALSEGLSKPYAQMTQGEQTTLRYNYLMKVTKDAQGDFAKTSGSLANQMRIAQLNIQGLAADLGKILLPVAQEAVKSFNDVAGKLKAAFQSEEVKTSIQSIAKGIGELVTGLTTLIVEWLPKIITGFAWLLNNASAITAGIIGIGTALAVLNVASTITGLVKAFTDAQKILPGLTAAQWLYNISIGALGGPVVIIAALIAGLVAATIYLWNTNEGFRTAVIGIWNAIKNSVMGVVTAIVNFFTVTIPEAFNSFVGFFANILTAIITWGASVIAWITTNIPLIVGNIVTFFSELPGKIVAFFTNIYNGFMTWGASVIAWVVTTVPLIINSITTFFNELPYKLGYALGFAIGTIIAWGISVWTYLVTNVPIWINSVVTFFSQLPGRIWAWLVNSYTNIVTWGTNTYISATTWISNTVNAVVTWFSQLPGRIWAWLVNAYTKVVTWGSQVYSNMSSAVSRSISAVINWFAQLPGRIWSWLSSTLSKVAQFASNLGAKASQAGANMVSNIINAVTSLPSRMASIGGNIVRGIWNGITGMAGWLASKVAGFASGIVAGIKGALDIHSPSRVLRDEVGKYIPQGVGLGIDDEMPNLQKDIQANMSDLIAKMQGTVDFETARTTASVVAQHNLSIEKDNQTVDTTDKANNNQTFIAKLIVDGKEFTQTVVAPNQDVLETWGAGR